MTWLSAKLHRPQAYTYITKNFKHVTPYAIGGMRALASCFEVDELNERGYGMYVSGFVMLPSLSGRP